MSFGMKKPAPDNPEMWPVKYQFLKPTRLRIQKLDGRTVLEGFGVGEVVVVLEPRVQFLIPAYERLKKIEMPGGAFIVEWPEDVWAVRIHD